MQLLTILKLVGVFVSGFGAIIGALSKKRRAKPTNESWIKQLWHKFTTRQAGLCIAIIGFLVAVLSQFAETRQGLSESKDGLRVIEWVTLSLFWGPMRVKTSRGAGFEPQLAPPCG